MGKVSCWELEFRSPAARGKRAGQTVTSALGRWRQWVVEGSLASYFSWNGQTPGSVRLRVQGEALSRLEINSAVKSSFCCPRGC